MNIKLPLQWMAVLLILVTGFFHYVTAPAEYAEARYMGVLFLANFLGSVISAIGIARGRLWLGWILGAVIAAGSIVGYIQSRTVGMPGMDVEEWIDPIGIPAMIVEGLFLVLFVLAKPWAGSVVKEISHPDDSVVNLQPAHLAATALILSIGFLHLVKTTEIYESTKDICGIAFALSRADIDTMVKAGMPMQVVYVGLLFPVLFLASIASALGIHRQKFWMGWALGAVIPVGTLFGFIQVKPLLIPGVGVNGWFDPIGIALLMEMLFLTVFIWTRRTSPRPKSLLTNNAGGMPAYTTVGILAAVAVSVISYQSGMRDLAYAGHLLPEVVVSNEAFEEEYGVRLTLVAVTAAGGLVDVRYRIIDPVKAAALIDEKDGGIMPMVYIGDGDTMLMPDSHMRDQRLIADRMYFNLIPNTQNAVQRGMTVTVVFGDIALEPVIVQ